MFTFLWPNSRQKRCKKINDWKFRENVYNNMLIWKQQWNTKIFKKFHDNERAPNPPGSILLTELSIVLTELRNLKHDEIADTSLRIKIQGKKQDSTGLRKSATDVVFGFAAGNEIPGLNCVMGRDNDKNLNKSWRFTS